MFTNALLPDTLRVIKLINQNRIIKDAYLAGGTALALQIGHRISVDLDFFTLKEFDENTLEIELQKTGFYKGDGKAWKTIWGMISQTKFSLFYYPYKIISDYINFEGINLISKPDIAAMKINAIETRGSKRDFIDLFFLAKDYSIEQMLEFYNLKYQTLQDHLYIIIRSLGYFEDAEMDEKSPQMLIDVSWPEVKNFFQKESLRLAKEKLNIP